MRLSQSKTQISGLGRFWMSRTGQASELVQWLTSDRDKGSIFEPCFPGNGNGTSPGCDGGGPGASPHLILAAPKVLSTNHHRVRRACRCQSPNEEPGSSRLCLCTPVNLTLSVPVNRSLRCGCCYSFCNSICLVSLVVLWVGTYSQTKI